MKMLNKLELLIKNEHNVMMCYLYWIYFGIYLMYGV